MASALPSNALYDVQRYLRQKRATGAQVTPQNERAAWSGYFDTMERNSLAERASAMRERQIRWDREAQKDAQEAAEGAATMSGFGQLASTAGQGALLLKGTSLGSKIGLGPTTAPTATSTSTGTSGGAALTSASGAPGAITGGAANSLPTAASGGPGVGITAAEQAALNNAPAVGAETGFLSAATPYAGPAGVAFAAGSIVPNLLGIKNETGRVATGALTGAAGGALMGAEYGTAAGPYGTAIGAVIGAVAGGIGAKIK
jgi:hypothetical protein